MSQIEFTPSSARVLRLGVALCLVLFVVHVVISMSAEHLGAGGIEILDLGRDSAIPTWIAAVILAASALAFTTRWMIARAAGEPEQHRWLGLALVFALLSIDEVGTIHEWVGSQMSDVFGEQEGLLRYQWIIVGAPLAAAVTAWYAPFVLRLEARARNLFLVGGSLFVGGAIVIEAFNGKLDDDGGAETLRYRLQTGVEELAEFLGAVCFLAAAVCVLEATGWRFTLRSPETAATEADEPLSA